MNIEDEKIIVLNCMIEYGGSFVKALGQALAHADSINTKKIKETWPNLWGEYLEKSNSKSKQSKLQ